MNTYPGENPMIRSLLCAAVLIPAVFGAVAANAQDGEAPQVHLSFANVDFNDSAQVDRFYDRLKVAARRVCESNTPMASITDPNAERTCRNDAVKGAVREINRPQLTQVAQLDSRDAPALAMNVTRNTSAR